MKNYVSFVLLCVLTVAFCGCVKTDPQIKRSQELEQGLKANLENFKSLRASLDESSRNFEEQKAKRLSEIEAGEKIADQIADALDKDEYPVSILGASYDDRETLSVQLESILNQIQSAKTAVDNFKSIERDVLNKQQSLILKISETENQLATYDVKRALFVAGKATDETALLVAEMDKLFERNESFIKDNPIRTIEELAKADADEKEATEREKRIEEYLKNRREQKDAAADANEDVAETVIENVEETSAESALAYDKTSSKSTTPLADAFLRLRAASQDNENVKETSDKDVNVESQIEFDDNGSESGLVVEPADEAQND